MLIYNRFCKLKKRELLMIQNKTISMFLTYENTLPRDVPRWELASYEEGGDDDGLLEDDYSAHYTKAEALKQVTALKKKYFLQGFSKVTVTKTGRNNCPISKSYDS